MKTFKDAVLIFFLIGIVSWGFSFGAKMLGENKAKEGITAKDLSEFMSIEDMRAGYMEGCMVIDELEDYCNCTWDRLLEIIGTDGILDATIKFIDTREYPVSFENAMEYCMPEFIESYNSYE